jgi:hypothetical protein
MLFQYSITVIESHRSRIPILGGVFFSIPQFYWQKRKCGYKSETSVTKNPFAFSGATIITVTQEKK